MRSKLVIALVIFLGSAFSSDGQLLFSFTDLRKTFDKSDSLSILTAEAVSVNPVDVLSDSTAAIENALDKLLLKNFKSIRRDTLKESMILKELAVFSVDHWQGSSFSKPKSMARIRRNLYRAFYHSNCRFGMLSVSSFSVPLTERGAFYYDKKGTDGGFQLYKGRKKPAATKEEPEPEAIPVKLLTEQELYGLLAKQLKRQHCYKELKAGRISYVGYAIVPDRRTFFRPGQQPQVRVVLLFGSKRLQMIKQKKSLPLYRKGFTLEML